MNRSNAPTTTIIHDQKSFWWHDQKSYQKGDKLSRTSNYEHHAVVRSFGGTKTEDYIQPTVNLSPKQIILHCGTSNIPSSEDSETIANNIINLAKNIKTDTAKVAILGIIPRADTFNLSTKQVNETLKKICKEEIIPFILHHGINTSFHLVSRGLHLYDKGATRFAQKFKRILSDIEFV